MNLKTVARGALVIFVVLALIYFGLTAVAFLFNAHNIFATLLLMLLVAAIIAGLILIARKATKS